MKNNLKKIKPLFIILFAILFSCEKDLYDDVLLKEKSNNVKFKTIKISEIKKYNTKTAKALIKFQNSPDNLFSKSSSIYGKEIDTTNIIYLAKTDGFESFTFKVLQTEGLNHFENIIINNSPNGNIEVIIAKFNLTKPLELVKLDNDFKTSLLNVEASKLDNTNNNFANRDCITVGYYDTVDACEGELVTPGENPECFNADGTRAQKEIFIVLAEDCSNSGGGTSGGVVVGPPTGGGDESGGSGGSGGEYGTIFIPNPYEGEEDPNNQSYVLANQIASFISSIKNSSYQMQLLFNNTSWLHAALIDFGNDNDDFTQEDKDAITFALNNIGPVFNTIYQNSNDLSANEIDVLKYNALNFLLNNPNPQSVSSYIELMNVATATGGSFVLESSISPSNGLVFASTVDLQNYLISLNSNLTTEITSSSQGNTKVGKIKRNIGAFTYITTEVNQTLSPYSVNGVSSYISGNTLCLSYNQATPSDLVQITTNNNVVTLSFSSTLNINALNDNIGTLWTFDLTIIVKVNKLTGEIISMDITGLP